MSSISRRPFYLAGEKTSSDSYWDIVVPGEKQPFVQVAKASAEHLEKAIEATVSAFETTKKIPAYKRIEILQKTAANMEKEHELLAQDLFREAGKPIKLARGEVDRAILTMKISAEEASRLGGEVLNLDVTPDAAGLTSYVKRIPLGPIAAITPFNFPLNLVAHKMGPAVAAGCPIVLKPSENTPLSALNLARLLLNAGWPAEALSVITCPVEEASPLVEDERFKLITFTGSAKVGWHIKDRAGKKRVALELGGNAAVVIDDSTDLAAIARRCAVGAFAYAGQSCISVQRVYVQWQAKKQFLRLLMEETERIKTGSIEDPDVLVGPLINEQAADRVESWVEEARSQGAHVLIGGERDGLYYKPTILTQVTNKMKVSSAEIFGPVVVVDSFDGWDEALHKANDSEYGLQVGVFTNNLAHANKAIADLDSGAVLINEIPTYRIDPQPYGGVKNSGFGKEGPRYAIREMTEEKLIIIR